MILSRWYVGVVFQRSELEEDRQQLEDERRSLVQQREVTITTSLKEMSTVCKN